MIGGVFGLAGRRNDGQAGGDVQGLQRAGEAAVPPGLFWGFGEGAEGDGHGRVS